MSHIIENNERYITTDVVESCLEIGNVIDKVYTGNGFTTAYSNLINLTDKPDLLIVPNIKVAQGKRYEKTFARGKKVLYFYSGSDTKLPKDLSRIDLIVTVADSFLYKRLDKFDYRYILLDEHHTAIVQTTFRSKLVELFEVLKHKDNVSFVTATPFDLGEVDVTINNTHPYFNKNKVLNISNSYNATIERIRNTKGRIILASNEAVFMCDVLSHIDENEVNLMCGDGLRASLLKRKILKVNKNARVTIMSTASFEGHDIYTEDTSVFVFQNTKAKHVQFLDCQIIQALGRVRVKPKHLELVWLSKSYGAPLITSEAIGEKYTDIKDICAKYCKVYNGRTERSTESDNFQFRYKGGLVRLGSVRDFVAFKDVKNDRVAFVNEKACDVFIKKVKQFYLDTEFNSHYYNTRGYNLSYYDEVQTPPSEIVKMSPSEKARKLCLNYINNPEYISINEVIRWSFQKNKDSRNALSTVYTALCENLTRKEIPKRVHAFFKNYENMNEIVNRCISLYSKDEMKEKERNGLNIEILEEYIIDVVFCLLKYSEPARKIRGFRNYNSFASVGTRIHNEIAPMFDMVATSFDLPAFAPTAIQILAGDAPVNLYDEGENRKKSKVAINKAFNSIYLRSKTGQRAMSLLKHNARIGTKTVNYLKENFYNNGISSKLINAWTYHERELINIALDKIKYSFGEVSFSVTRHDEILTFHDKDNNLNTMVQNLINEIEYLGYNNWFKSPQPTGQKAKKEVKKMKNVHRKRSVSMGLSENVTPIYNGTTQLDMFTKLFSIDRNNPHQFKKPNYHIRE